MWELVTPELPLSRKKADLEQSIEHICRLVDGGRIDESMPTYERCESHSHG